jgi:hypothetical protein
MGAVYSVVMKDQTIIASSDLVIIRTAAAIGTAGSTIRILRAWCSQGATEVSEQLGIQIALQAAAFGTYTAATPRAHLVGGPISAIVGGTAGAAATAGVDASANAAGTKTEVVADGFNNLNGWLWVPTPEERILVPVDTAVVLAMIGTATTLTNWYAGITFEQSPN